MKANIVYPYPLFGGELTCRLRKLQIEGDILPIDLKVGDTLNLHLFDLAIDWTELTFRVDFTASPAELQSLEAKVADLTALCVVNCGPTNVRQSLELQRRSQESATWSGEARLDRDNFAGKATLQVVLVATVDGTSHRPVGHSDVWSLHFDEPEVPLFGGSLRVEWHNFRGGDAPVLARQYPDAPYVADLEETSPVIYLNSSLDGLRTVLDKPGSRTPEVQKVLHQSFRMGLARSVWFAMFSAAVAAIEVEGDVDDDVTASVRAGDAEPQWPVSDWKTQVLKHLLPELYPSKSESDALREVFLSSKEGMDSLASRIEAILGEHIGSNKVLRKALHGLATREVMA